MKIILSIVLLLPLSLFAKYVKTIQLDEPPRQAFIDDEAVYIVTTTAHKYNEARFDTKLEQFVDARSKRVLAFAEGERIIKLDRLGGIGTGGNVVGFASLEIKQGIVAFAYPFDSEIGKAEVCSNFLVHAVDGDRIAYHSIGTNYSFVASFSPKDNILHWLDPVTFDVCEPLPPPDHDKPFCYSRMQQTNSIIPIVGGRIQKDIGIVRFSEHDIDEVYRIVENAGPEHHIAKDSLLYSNPLRKAKADRPSVLTPRKFYVVLKDGRKAYGMFQRPTEKNLVLFSPITSAHLAVAKSDIFGFEAIADGSFPISECYSKNEVSNLYERFTMPQDETSLTIGKMLCAIVIACLGWLIPILLEPLSDTVQKWFASHRRIRWFAIGLSLISALIFYIFT